MNIYKYQAKPGAFTVPLPEGAKVLSVGVQYEDICFWALVDPDAPKTLRRFAAVATGEPLPEEFMHVIGAEWPRFIGTVQFHAMVFHLFEMSPEGA